MQKSKNAERFRMAKLCLRIGQRLKAGIFTAKGNRGSEVRVIPPKSAKIDPN